MVEPPEDLTEVIKDKLGNLFLKLQSCFEVPNQCADETVAEIRFISSSAPGPVFGHISGSIFQSQSFDLDSSLLSDLVKKEISESQPLSSALGKDGPLGTSYK